MGTAKPIIEFSVVVVAALGLALLYFFADARIVTFFPPCPFHRLTGLFCPGCGSQRAISALLHGQLLHAIRFNLLLVCCLPLLAYSAYTSTLKLSAQKPQIQRLFYSPLFVKSFLVMVIMFFILRNIPSYPFNLLAPHSLR